MLLALALAAALASPQAPATAPASELTPDQQAAGLAGTTFAFGCLQRLGVATSAADFAHGSDALGAQLAHDMPAAATAVQIDGNGGRGCRVRYVGPYADRMWTAYLGVLAKAPGPAQGGCTVVEQTDARVRAACVDPAATPPHRADLLMERSGVGAAGRVSVSLAWTQPT